MASCDRGPEQGRPGHELREAWSRGSPAARPFSRLGATSRMLWFLVTWVPCLGAEHLNAPAPRSLRTPFQEEVFKQSPGLKSSHQNTLGFSAALFPSPMTPLV